MGTMMGMPGSTAAQVAAGIAAVGMGAMLGAWLRWMLGAALNLVYPLLPLGTLAANIAGGFMVGLAVAYFAHHPDIAPQWRLFIVTGFLGGLTTFSSFSAESMLLLQRGDYGWALLHTSVHVLGALLACMGGHALALAWMRAFNP